MRMTRNRLLFLYLGTPILLAIYNSLRGSIWSPSVGTAKMLFMALACALPLWAFSAITAHVLLNVTQKFKIHPFFALAATLIFAVPFSYFVVLEFIIWFGPIFPGLGDGLAADGKSLVGGLKNYSATYLFSIVWLIANLIYEYATGEVVFYRGFIHRPASLPAAANGKVDSDPKAAAHESAPKFLQRVRPSLGAKVLALEAQQHYVKVYTDRGTDMILYRFSDAVQEVASTSGLQVHRSYWVAHDAVADICGSGKNYKLTLHNGLTVPVSRSYRGAVQRYRVSFERNHLAGSKFGSIAAPSRAS
ncbi:MAG: LytTR family DNA-binding domain-containing protein [Rhodospirillaceae bacterium]|nr:LytTR family DNA-binding domain-containing protein [Rhodospirillaceae bacterium]